jgi:hypothetical protein
VAAAKLKQINVRPDAETLALLDRVQRSASAAVGLRLSITAIFRLGLIELDRKYPSEGPANGRAAAKRTRRRA